jgi:hypothetical protein
MRVSTCYTHLRLLLVVYVVYAVYGLGLLLVPEAIPDRHQHAPIIDMLGRKYRFKSWRWKKLATSKESLEDESQI